MLEGIDQVNWSELSACGLATDLPELLRALASEEKDVRDDALSELYETICHQGTVYEATAYAVPFLIELLFAPNVADKANILALLQELSTGSSYLDVHQEASWYYNERNTAEFQTRLQREQEWVQAVRQAVVDGTPVYLQLLSHPEPDVRSMAPFVLATCIPRVNEIEPALRQHMTAEAEPQVKASLVMGLAQLWRQVRSLEPTQKALGNEQNSYLVSLMRRQQEFPHVRFVAALSLVKLGCKGLIEEAIAVFQQTIESCQETISKLPWTEDGSPLSPPSKALTPYPDLRLQWLLAMLSHTNAALRKDTVWQIKTLCQERRSAPEVVVPHLARLVADADPNVRQTVAWVLPELGKARFSAVETLQALLHHPDVKVQHLTQKTLEKVCEKRDEYDLKRWLSTPKLDRDVNELISVLEAKGDSCKQSDMYDCLDAVRCLEFMGKTAHGAVPTLRKALTHTYAWVRVHAARSLWKIEENAEEVLPVLLEELRCGPLGQIVADCLGEMGHQAQTAIPTLQRIVNSEERLVEISTDNDWIDEDEAFCTAAQSTLERIQVDCTSQL